MDMENIIMEIVVSSGDARSKALEAVHCARKGDFGGAERLFTECDLALQKSHEVQTDLIQAEVRGEHTPVTLLMVHAQDHMMNALTVKDIAQQLVLMIQEQKGN